MAAIADAPAPEVLVVGEALVDVIRTPDGVVTESVGGSPANVALGLGRQGVPVALLTAVADDERGRRIVDHLERSGVAVMPESWSLRRTATATARIGGDGQAHYAFDVEWRIPPIRSARRPAVVHAGSIAAFLEPGAGVVRDHLRSAPADVVSVDPNIRPSLLGPRGEVVPVFDELVRYATTVKLSDEDAAWLYPGEEVDACIDSLLARGPHLVVVTLGAGGAVLATPSGRVRVPAVRVAAVDTVGAGDTFMASLLASIVAAGGDRFAVDELAAVGRRAAAAAAITVSRAGADLPWAHELAG